MDFALTHVRALARYNQWMNARMYELAAELGDEQRKQDQGAFFKSIHGTFNHLLLADKIWLGRFLGEPFVVQSLAQELYADFDELRSERVHTDEKIVQWADALTVEDWQGELRFTPVTNPVEKVLPMWLVVSHFFNHQTHHRGQVTTLFSQLGMDPGVTDLLMLPR